MKSDTHFVVAKYEFEDHGSPEYSTTLYVGTEQDCHEMARTITLPGYPGARQVRDTKAIVVPLPECPD